MKRFIFLVIFILICNLANALTMTIPFRCWEEELIKEFKEVGINLDKNDPFSDGFIENMGANYKIHLYKIPKNEYMRLFVDIPLKVERKLQEVLKRR